MAGAELPDEHRSLTAVSQDMADQAAGGAFPFCAGNADCLPAKASASACVWEVMNLPLQGR